MGPASADRTPHTHEGVPADITAEHIKVYQANVSSLNKDVIAWLVHKKYDVLLLQEHRLQGPKYHTHLKMLQKYYHTISRPAKTKISGPSGGVLFACLKGMHLTFNPMVHIDSTGNSVVATLRVNGGNYAFASAYISYPLMYAFEDSSIFVNYFFLVTFISGSVLGFISLVKKNG